MMANVNKNILLFLITAVAQIISCLSLSAGTPSVEPSFVPTLSPSKARSSQTSIQTFAGTGTATSSGSGGAATAAGIGNPRFVWMDSANALYIAEWSANCVRKVDSSGIVQKVVGVCNYASTTADGVPATAAILNAAYGIFISSAGIVYVNEYSNNKIRYVSLANIIGTFGGTGATSNTNDNGQATSAGIYTPFGIWGNTAGTVYVSSFSGYKFRAISTSGIITTLAGTGSAGSSGDGGFATAAYFMQPRGIFADTVGRFYLTDAGSGVHSVKTIDSSSIITTFAGTGTPGYSGESLAATSSSLNTPGGVVKDSNNGDVFIASYSAFRVMVVTGSNNKMTTFVGTGTSSYSGDGGAATAAKLQSVEGLYWDQAKSNLYMADLSGARVRMTYTTDPTGTPSYAPSFAATQSPTSYYQRGIKLVMGTGTSSSTGTGGLATAATLSSPRSVQSDTTGLVYVSEYGAHCIRTIDTSNIVHAYAGVCGTSGSSGDGGAATSALMNQPTDFFVFSVGAVYITDTNNNKLRGVIMSSNQMVYLGGTGSSTNSGDGGPVTAAGIYRPYSIWVSSMGTGLYVAQYNSNVVRIVVGSTISAFAGTYSPSFSGDNGAATSAAVSGPQRVYGDSTGRMYIADGDNHRVRRVSTANIITTYMGTGSTGYSGEGLAPTSTNLYIPCGMAVDSTYGNFYVNSFVHYRTYYVSSATQTVNTVIGTGTSGSSGDGGAATAATLAGPDGLFLDPTSGLLYVVDQTNNKLRAAYSTAPTLSPTVAPSVSMAPTISMAPSAVPSVKPTTFSPTALPTTALPTVAPTIKPSAAPSVSFAPSWSMSPTYSMAPSFAPTKARTTYTTMKLFAGTGDAASADSGSNAISTSFNNPRSVWVDTTGVVYIVEVDSNCVKIVDSASIVHDYLGTCYNEGSFTEGVAGTSSLLNLPMSIVVSTTGVFYVTDYFNHQVHSVDATGITANVAGAGGGSDDGDGGKATAANIYGPHGLWVDSVGVVYIGLHAGGQVRVVDTNNIIFTIAGTSSAGISDDGLRATSSSLQYVQRLLVDTTGLVYIAEQGTNSVRTITNGNLRAFLGTRETDYNGDGLPATSTNVNFASGLAIDTVNGDIYVNSYGLNRVLVVTAATNTVSTFAGTGEAGYAGDDGPATSASFYKPDGICLDHDTGSLYVADSGNNRIRLIQNTEPTASPTLPPTQLPTVVPTTMSPTRVPTTRTPTVAPTTALPTPATLAPTLAPSQVPTVSPSLSYLSIRSSPSYKVTNALAFAGITSNGSVIAWGASESGGDCSSVSSRLNDVVEIVSSKHAFAALSSIGEVTAWGNEREISGWSAATSGVTVTSLVAAERAFAGVTSTGGVIGFGADCCGGNVDQYGWAQYLSSDVKIIAASAGAFCALKTDGSVYCWGSEFAGGGVSSESRSDLSDIVLLSSTRSAFAGMTSDGSVVAWGNTHFGGKLPSSVLTATSGTTVHLLSNGVMFAAYTSSHTLPSGHNLVSWGNGEYNLAMGSAVKYVAHTATAFAAIRNNGSVVAWGDTESGGGMSLSENITHVVGSHAAFAALADSGSVTVWGDSERGGTTSLDGTWQLDSIYSVIATSRAFAALNTSGSVIAWGAASSGGSISAGISSDLTSGVKMLCANELAFTAIKSDGSAFMWGFSKAVTGNGILTGNYSTIVSC